MKKENKSSIQISYQPEAEEYLESVIPVLRDLHANNVKLKRVEVGFNYVEQANNAIEGLGPHKITLTMLGIRHQVPSFYYYGDHLIRDETNSSRSSSTGIIEAQFQFNNENYRLDSAYSELRDRKLDTHVTHGTTIKPEVNLDLRNTPFPFSIIGFRHELVSDEQRARISRLAERRLSSSYYSNVFGYHSEVKAKKRVEGFDVIPTLHLQNPNEDAHLKCYEVEIFDGEVKNIPETLEVAPESIWQDKENHYCLIEQDSFPLIPFDMRRAKSLNIKIATDEALVQSVLSSLGELPLSFDGSNEWYAQFATPTGKVNVLHAPRWRRDRIKLVHTTLALNEELSAERILSATSEIQTLKSFFKAL